MYVNGNPMGDVDPSGYNLVSDTCSALPAFFLSPKNLIGDATKLIGYSSQLLKVSCISTLQSFLLFAGKQIIAFELAKEFPLNTTDSTYAQTQKYFVIIQTAIAIGCSIDYNKTACGAPELAWLLGGYAGKVVGDTLDVGYAVCAIGGFSNVACDAFALYELANRVYQFLYNLFGWGPPQLTGSLLPRPGGSWRTRNLTHRNSKSKLGYQRYFRTTLAEKVGNG